MKITDLDSLLTLSGFKRTEVPFTLPLIVHGVPGCGKSTFIRSLLTNIHVQARTCGPPYGRSLLTPGVTPYQSQELLQSPIRILDEYQHLGAIPAEFNVLFGDPFQGQLQAEPHYFKEYSHRVPKPIATFLSQRDYQISSELPGTLLTASPFSCDQHTFLDSHCILHLGPISKELAENHYLPTRCPKEVAGLEFNKVTLIYHSSELSDRSSFYIACTRSSQTLILLSDEFHELQTTS